MTNQDVVIKFLNKQFCKGSNLYAEDNKLYSYQTCIAEWYKDKLLVNLTKYSKSTTKHQSYIGNNINKIIPKINNKVYLLYDIPLGISYLNGYYKN